MDKSQLFWESSYRSSTFIHNARQLHDLGTGWSEGRGMFASRNDRGFSDAKRTQLLALFLDVRSSWIRAILGAVEHLCDELPVPIQDGLGFHDAGNLVQSLVCQAAFRSRPSPPFIEPWRLRFLPVL
ncbi:MAG: hypothetical protein BMS9Abin37_1750 [Acidobacteriota bacterium]|nr:MAG: hypothetical protein BMS9Abin37_1750 [Acidobacteriota bacterium]